MSAKMYTASLLWVYNRKFWKIPKWLELRIFTPTAVSSAPFRLCVKQCDSDAPQIIKFLTTFFLWKNLIVAKNIVAYLCLKFPVVRGTSSLGMQLILHVIAKGDTQGMKERLESLMTSQSPKTSFFYIRKISPKWEGEDKKPTSLA